MSQILFDTINPDTTSGNQLAQILNDFKSAVVSGMIGPARPSELEEGGSWVDNSLKISQNVLDFKIYTGAVDITVFRLNLATGTTSIGGSENAFEVSRISADAVGPLLKLVKERVANNGKTLIGDVLGEVQFVSTTDAGINNPSARIKSIALDDGIPTEFGANLIFETVSQDSNVLTETMRVQNGNLSIGTISASEKLHVAGNIKSEKISDDVVGVKRIAKKKRVSGNGQVLNGDVIAVEDYRSTDQNGAEINAAEIEVSATQNHTDVAQGSKIVFKTKNTGSASFTNKMTIDDNGVTIPVLNVTTMTTGTVVEIVDANIVLNKGGNQSSANSQTSGLTVEMSDATHAVFGYDSTLASKFKIGEVGTLKEVVDVSSTQALTNKTLTSPSISTPTRLDVKQGTEAALTTYALTASNGQWCFATDTKVMYQVIDTLLSPAGSGGGGGSLVWNLGGSTPAVYEVVDGFDFHSFDFESLQEIYAIIAVPSTYRAGKPIKLKGGQFFCNTSAGKVFFKTQTALIKSNSVLGTYPNIRTSTNTVVTVNAVANTNNSVGDLDLTSTIGEINSVAVVAGDKLRVRLYRDNASEAGGAGPASADARLLSTSLELTFS